MRAFIQEQQHHTIISIQEQIIGKKECKALTKLLQEVAEKATTIIIEMKQVRQAVPEFYLTLLRNVKKSGVAIKLADVQKQIRIILEVSKLFELFPIIPSVDAYREVIEREVSYGSLR